MMKKVFSTTALLLPLPLGEGWGEGRFIMPFALVLFLFLLSGSVMATDLGRLFTTPEERAALEKLRHQKPVQKVKPEIVIDEPEPAEEKPEIGGITVHGLVYRNGGKSTAWVNSGNTYEGDLGNQYLQIDAGNIKPEDVVIEIPITDTTLSLKAGETFSPEAEESAEPDYNHK